jgi:hypothetical protein
MAEGLGDVVDADQAQNADGEVAKGGHHAGSVPGASLGTVFVEGDVAKKLAQLPIGFPGQVVLVNGDSHFLQIVKPLADAAGQTIQNFTRVQTFGSEQNHWVSADVDPGDPAVFTFHQHVVASNVPAYVTP